MKHLALVLSIPLLSWVVCTANAAPVIFIVRHAEKASGGGNDPDLSPAGQKRADALARILKDSQITSAFVQNSSATITRKSLPSSLAMDHASSGCIIRFEKTPNFLCVEIFASHKS